MRRAILNIWFNTEPSFHSVSLARFFLTDRLVLLYISFLMKLFNKNVTEAKQNVCVKSPVMA